MDIRSTRTALTLCFSAGMIDLVVLDARIAPSLVGVPDAIMRLATTQLTSAQLAVSPASVEPAPNSEPAPNAGDTRLVYFETNSASLDARARAVVEEIAALEGRSGVQTEVEIDVTGHADPRGGAVYNQGLSEKRAAAVSRALAHYGVRVKDAAGLGASHPVRDGRDPTALKLDRRVEIRIVRGQP
jgi:outer membrane protein OmpA-like peptidoglycan-associated protein